MLPTHFVTTRSTTPPSAASLSVPSKSSPQNAASSVTMTSSVQSRPSGNGDSSYPPTSSHRAGAPPGKPAPSIPSSPLVRRIFGSRGIAALTIDTSPLSQQISQSSPAASVSTSASARNEARRTATKRGRWHTLEFKLYYLVFLFAVPLMVYVPVKLSLESNPNYYTYSGHLRPGWIFGRLRDDSDFQYRGFRDYLPALAGIMVVYVILSKAFTLLPSGQRAYQRVGAEAQTTQPNRIPFLLVFTSVFVFALHGTNTIKLLLVCWLNYQLAKLLGGMRIAPALTFAFNVATLFAIHWNDGFEWHAISPALNFLEFFKGLLPRWQINFNITMLRLVSFAFDYHWAKGEAQDGSHPGRGRAAAEDREATYQERTRTSRHLDEYSFLNYILYALYPPLFIAGPIVTFNDFAAQLYRPTRIQTRTVIKYGLRFLASLMTMELILHFIYVNAIKDTKAWVRATPLDLSMIGFWNLIIVWLKLLLPWRFFRLWAMADGVDAPENMVRCMANNYSTLGFWRSWHRSYNLWIVRYIYVPLGGSRNQIPATLLVFTFVALWHDLSLKLLAWGWLITFFIVPEVVARKLVPASRFGEEWWYRHVAAVGGVGNVLMMMTGNLVGFAIGTDGMRYMAEQLLGSWEGVRFMLGACAILFVGVQVMFEYREEELRRGIDRKC
ncbi:MBOAT-domain-containing protein [Testicularia cyperi]|uniref:MBOAT-domain-containing protein n=1 Tax=Testicularia cyperi TaxID=1882483 RepID=A0A317Y2L4_9BASI|nr:MBOAT-domain-containing protein [Testicularia cyperi]